MAKAAKTTKTTKTTKTANAASEKKEKVAESVNVDDVKNDVDESAKPKKRAQAANPNGVQKAKKTAKPKANATGVKKAKETMTIKAPAAAPRVASRSPSIPDMTINALSTLKDRKGHTLAAIRNFISTQHNRVVNKTFQGHIRKFIEKEFLEGRIRMTNSDGEQINFSKRFALAK